MWCVFLQTTYVLLQVFFCLLIIWTEAMTRFSPPCSLQRHSCRPLCFNPLESQMSSFLQTSWMFLPLFLFSITSIHVGECSCKPLVNCRDFWYAHILNRVVLSHREVPPPAPPSPLATIRPSCRTYCKAGGDFFKLSANCYRLKWSLKAGRELRPAGAHRASYISRRTSDTLLLTLWLWTPHVCCGLRNTPCV